MRRRAARLTTLRPVQAQDPQAQPRSQARLRTQREVGQPVEDNLGGQHDLLPATDAARLFTQRAGRRSSAARQQDNGLVNNISYCILGGRGGLLSTLVDIFMDLLGSFGWMDQTC